MGNTFEPGLQGIAELPGAVDLLAGAAGEGDTSVVINDPLQPPLQRAAEGPGAIELAPGDVGGARRQVAGRGGQRGEPVGQVAGEGLHGWLHCRGPV